MTKVLVLYHSMYGHIETMANAVAEGARDVAGVEVTVKRVPETMDAEIFKNAGGKTDQAAAVATPAELAEYDAIIVDEGQDFGDSRTIALLELLRGPEAQWIFFADWNQDVYRAKSDTPLGAEVVFRLYHNCRNTISVTLATNRYCDMTVEPMPGSPQGEPPLLDFRKTPAAVAMRAWEIVHELAPEGRAAILGPYKLENSCMAGTVRGHGLELTQDPSKLGVSGYVYYSTVRAFKGLEAAVVVVVQAEAPGSIPSLSLEDLYVACTRARARLAIVVGSESAHGWFASHLK